MAARCKSATRAGSVRITFFPCTSCNDNAIVQNAVCFCEQCEYFFCILCSGVHDQLLKKHIKYSKFDMKYWPVSKDLVAFLQKCEKHTNKRVEMYCNDHSQLCCCTCISVSHRKCKKVALYSAKKHTAADMHELLERLQNTLFKLDMLKRCCNINIEISKGSYQKQELMVREMNKKINSISKKNIRCNLLKTPKAEKIMVKQMHQSIHTTLEEIEKSTLSETKQALSILQASLKTCFETCSIHYQKLLLLLEALQYTSDKNKTELCFIAISKCIDKIQKVEIYLNENFVECERSLLNQTIRDCEQYLSKLSGLWKCVQRSKAVTYQANSELDQYLFRLERKVLSNQVFTVVQKNEQNVRILSDSSKCYVTAICVLPDGLVLVADRDNEKIKLLDQYCRIMSHLDVNARPWGICPITPSQVAVTVDGGNTHEIQFITVYNRKLVTSRKLPLQHTCAGIAHHHGDLFVTSDTALYKYSLNEKDVSKLYDDISQCLTVRRCDVSPTGDKLYLCYSQFKLITLARDGTHLATYTDLDSPRYVHVTPAGQLLVCGLLSHTIIQVDHKGMKKLATVATRKKDGVVGPVSVCYNSTTSSIIVGQMENDNILVFKVE